MAHTGPYGLDFESVLAVRGWEANWYGGMQLCPSDFLDCGRTSV